MSVFRGETSDAQDLSNGSYIGATPDAPSEWAGDAPIMSASFSGGGFVCFGNFLGGIAYLGVEFDIDGATHYGWIEVESSEFVPKVIVHIWAYESVPRASLLAGQIPEPSSTTLLLATVPIIFRRRRVRNDSR